MTQPNHAKLQGKVWDCRIGFASDAELGPTADGPMRFAVEMMFKVLTGHDAEFCFSGWDGQFSESELAAIASDNEVKEKC